MIYIIFKRTLKLKVFQPTLSHRFRWEYIRICIDGLDSVCSVLCSILTRLNFLLYSLCFSAGVFADLIMSIASSVAFLLVRSFFRRRYSRCLSAFVFLNFHFTVDGSIFISSFGVRSICNSCSYELIILFFESCAREKGVSIIHL